VDSSAHRISFLNHNPYLKEKDLLLFCLYCPCSEVLSFISEVLTVRDTVSRDFRDWKFLRFFSEVPNFEI
jgi:hypothetical protein